MRRRSGFTLVEMMVSVALVLLIMIILTEAFTAGLDSFRKLKALGDLEQRLRAATTLLRRELAHDHFEGKRRLSDPRFWEEGPPKEGFFHINHNTAPTGEGLDGDGLQSFRATDTVLSFSVKLRGNRREDWPTVALNDTNLPANERLSPYLPAIGFTPGSNADGRYQDVGTSTFASQWYEVTYFLVPTGQVTQPDPLTPGRQALPLYALHRRQRLAVPGEWYHANGTPVVDQFQLNWGQYKVNPFYDTRSQYPRHAAEVSCKFNPNTALFGFLYFNSPADLTIPERRFGMNQAKHPLTGALLHGKILGSGGVEQWPRNNDSSKFLRTLKDDDSQLEGADIVLSNVVSFEVKVLVAGSASFQHTPWFDTWSRIKDDNYDYSTVAVPNVVNVTAVQITLRLWDERTNTTRQMTFVQDM